MRKKQYYILSLPIKNMKVMLPVSNIEGLGLREVIEPSEVDYVIQVLSDEQSEMHSNWNRRYRDNMEKVKKWRYHRSGDGSKKSFNTG